MFLITQIYYQDTEVFAENVYFQSHLGENYYIYRKMYRTLYLENNSHNLQAVLCEVLDTSDNVKEWHALGELLNLRKTGVDIKGIEFPVMYYDIHISCVPAYLDAAKLKLMSGGSQGGSPLMTPQGELHDIPDTFIHGTTLTFPSTCTDLSYLRLSLINKVQAKGLKVVEINNARVLSKTRSCTHLERLVAHIPTLVLNCDFNLNVDTCRLLVADTIIVNGEFSIRNPRVLNDVVRDTFDTQGKSALFHRYSYSLQRILTEHTVQIVNKKNILVIDGFHNRMYTKNRN